MEENWNAGDVVDICINLHRQLNKPAYEKSLVCLI